MMRRLQCRIAPIAALLLGACSSLVEPPVRELSHPIQTDRLEYRVRRTGQGQEVNIPFTYTNETGRTVYVVNCNGQAPPYLEKQVDGQWVLAWAPVVPSCLSHPIEIRPGATYTDTLRVFAGRPKSNTYPQFVVERVTGTYRLVWSGLVHDYDANRSQGFGEPVPEAGRISNSFLLKE